MIDSLVSFKLPLGMFDVELFEDEDGAAPFEEWFAGLPAAVANRVQVALLRMEQGNLGDVKRVGEGVLEHRIHFGAGWRLYFGRDGQTLVVMLGGGTKKSQTRDIKVAQGLWKQYKQRKRRRTWH